MLNYRANGGRFDTPEDLKKIYGLTQAQYDDIAPFIRISITTVFMPEKYIIRAIGNCTAA